MSRIEDGIFTECCLTGTDIDATYKLWDDTYRLTAQTASTVGPLLLKRPSQAEYTLQDTHSIPTSAIEQEDIRVISHPDKVGLSTRVYTNSVGGTAGQQVKFKLYNDKTIDIVVYAGTWLPIATKGCNTAGLLVVA